MSERKFYRTVYTVEVLSEEPIAEEADLAWVVNEGTEGEFSMTYTEKHEEIDGKECAKLLEAQGSDPGFFQLDEVGEDHDG